MKRIFILLAMLLTLLSGTVSLAQAEDSSTTCSDLEIGDLHFYVAGEDDSSTKLATNAGVYITNPSDDLPGCVKVVSLQSYYLNARIYKGPSFSLAPGETRQFDVPLPDCQVQVYILDGAEIVYSEEAVEGPNCGERGETVLNCDAAADMVVDEFQVTDDEVFVTIRNDSSRCTFEGGVAFYGLDSLLKESATEQIDPGGHHEFMLARKNAGIIVAYWGPTVTTLQGSEGYVERLLGLGTVPFGAANTIINSACSFREDAAFSCPYFNAD